MASQARPKRCLGEVLGGRVRTGMVHKAASMHTRSYTNFQKGMLYMSEGSVCRKPPAELAQSRLESSAIIDCDLNMHALHAAS